MPHNLRQELEDVSNEIREMEQVLDQGWYRNMIGVTQETVGGLYTQLLTMPIETMGDMGKLMELRGRLRGIEMYGGLIETRIEDLKQTKEQLERKVENEPEQPTE